MKTKNHIVLILFLLAFEFNSFAQNVIYEPSESIIFSEKIELAKKENLFDKPINTVLTEIAKSFIGTEYGAHTIENYDAEKLKINFRQLDCYTFVETSLAIARVIKKKANPTFNDCLNEIRNIRYRNGKIENYASRLHYFTDWIYDLQKRGIIRDITLEIGGVPYEKKINFMSEHVLAYPQLNGDSSLADSIREIEKNISARKYFYIPQDEIASIESKINSGDIIAITTDIVGLDISHVGIAVRENKRIHLLHAPNIGFKVQISELPLADYIKSHKRQTGIMVVRAIEPKQAMKLQMEK